MCGVDRCENKAKQASTLKQHKADVRDLDVTYYLCMLMLIGALSEPMIFINIRQEFTVVNVKESSKI